MEKMPYTPEIDRTLALLHAQATATLTSSSVVTTDWKTDLPLLTGSRVTLRELRVSDAPSLFAMLTTDEVSRFISPPPATVEGFERFIMWANRERAAGNYVCFAVLPYGMDTAVGLFQVRQLEPAWGTAEWGFAIGSAFWGTGLFAEGAQLVLEFAFQTVGVHRLEARAAVLNGRGNGALRKLGAVQEGVLRRSFLRDGQYLDQALWAILADDWRAQLHTIAIPDRATVHEPAHSCSFTGPRLRRRARQSRWKLATLASPQPYRYGPLRRLARPE